MPDEDIATRLNLKVEQVRESIANFESMRHSASAEIVDMATNIEALSAIDGVGEDLRDARQASRFTGAYDGDGNPIFDRDWELMLNSVDKLTNLVAKMRPRGPGVVLNNLTQINKNGGNGSGGRSFESMVRLAAERRKSELQLGDGNGQKQLSAASDDDIIDAEGTAADGPSDGEEIIDDVGDGDVDRSDVELDDPEEFEEDEEEDED